MPTWINFKELRSKLKFESLLRYYQIEVKRKGDQHHDFCPLPRHKAKSASPTFSANLTRGIFQCFGCGAKGSVLDFALLMESTNPEDGRAVRMVALKLRRELLSDVMPVNSKRFIQKKPDPQSLAKKPVVLINAPLDFELKELERDHLSLLETGLTGTTVAHFGLGYCSRGMLKDRIAVPLHDQQGRLVGYAGRSLNPSGISQRNPEYLFPATRERNGTIYEFRKSLFLYNGFRIKAPCEELIVVQDFTSAWWLHQNGFPQVVALMGWECSDIQSELILRLVKTAGRLWIMPNGDKAGEQLDHSLLTRLSPYRFIRSVKLTNSRQPADFSSQEINSCFST